MRRTQLSKQPCSIARTLDIVGDWWAPLILRESFRGARRFSEFNERLGLSRNTLTSRLEHLVEQGMLEKVRYLERPERFEYRLTAKGDDFYPVLMAMMAWGDRWLAGKNGPPVIAEHRECGETVQGVYVCEVCGEPIMAESHADGVHTSFRTTHVHRQWPGRGDTGANTGEPESQAVPAEPGGAGVVGDSGAPR